MLFAGLVALQAGFVIHERTLATQAIAALLFPIPMVVGLALGLLLGPYRVPSLMFTIVALAAGVYLRRFGQRGLGVGMAVFFGAFFGFFLYTDLKLQDAGWLAADFEIGAVASVLVMIAFFRPQPEVSYLFMTIGITVMIAQLYVQLGELSWALLLTRLAETAVGVAAVVGTVLVVLPLRPGRVFNAGLLLWVRDFHALRGAAAVRLSGSGQPLRPFVRRADATYAALVTTTKTLRQVTFGRASSQFAEALAAACAAREYARSLVASLDGLPAGESATSMSADDFPLGIAVQLMSGSLDELEHRLATGERGRYVRFGSMVAVAVDDLRRAESPLVVPIRDLNYVDSALARLATALDMTVQEPERGTGDASRIAPAEGLLRLPASR